MPRGSHPRARVAASILAFLAAVPAAGTLYVAVGDGELADRSPVIVEGRVLAAETAPGGRPRTDYLVAVEERWKGATPEVATVRLPGGVGPDGLALAIAGVPRLEPGDQVLLFLTPGEEGAFVPRGLFLGVFRITEAGGRRIAVRDANGAREASGVGGDGARDLRKLRRWLGDRARGERRPADYFLAPAEPEGAAGGAAPGAKFLPIVSGTEPPPLGCGENGGHPVRWFDRRGGTGEGGGGSGPAIAWRSHFRGQRGVPEGGAAELEEALATWTGDPNSSLELVYAGLTDAAGGLERSDGVNAVLFDDPGDRIPGSFESTGILALGGPWFRCDLVEYRGESYHPIVEADIVTQDGVERFFAASRQPRRAAEELLAHELGHAVGFAHSGDPEALMYDAIHDDGRGAFLDVDDLAGLDALYGAGSLAPPAAPSALTAVAEGATRVRLTWSDGSGNESNFRLERRRDAPPAGGDFAPIAAVAADGTELVDAGLRPETAYAYRVRAQNGAGASPYSGEAAVTTLPDPRPTAPSNLRAAPLSDHRVRLTWQDNSGDESSFALSLRDPASGDFVEIPYAIPADTTVLLVSQLDPETAYAFRVRARNAFGTSVPSNTVSVTTFAAGVDCAESRSVLCLLGGRFRLEMTFADPRRESGEQTATALPSTDQTGLFWFFSPENLELIVKMLDGRALNGHFWVFFGGVSDLEYRLEITDVATGQRSTYHNAAGEICGQADILAFADDGLSGEAAPATPRSAGLPAAALAAVPAERGPAELAADGAKQEGACVPGAESLCLLDRRLRVEVRWKNPHDGGAEGIGQAVVGSDNSGYFWFFDPQNTELVVKALDGGAFNGHLWIFYGALTDLEYWIDVTDTFTGARRVYYNPPGKICGQADIEAFPTARP